MVLRRPYAFIIKHFKLLHMFLVGLVIYLITRIVTVINFVNEYLDSNLKFITEEQFNGLFNFLDFLIPIVILLFSLIMLFIMTMKKKPNKFYLYTTLISLINLILNIYAYATLKSLITVWLEVNVLNVLTDIYLFVLLALIAMCVMAISRALGFNLARFDFNNDISNFELSDADNEEFEVSFDFDSNDIKRDTKKKLRYLKYFYKENKTTIFGVCGAFIIVVLLYGGFSLLKYRKDVIKGTHLNYNGFDFEITDSYIINNDLDGKKLTDNKHLLVIIANVTNNSSTVDEIFSTGTLGVNIGNDNYNVTRKYDDLMLDFGKVYNDEKIKANATVKRIFVFDIPENHLFSRILLGVRELGAKTNHYLKINPKNLSDQKEKIIDESLNKKISLDESTIKDIKIKIDSFEISSKFKINYNYCTKSKKCINSIEYLVPRNDLSNYDKTILKLTGKFEFGKNSVYNNFYTLFNQFGYIEYEVNNIPKKQTSMFREVKSNRITEKDTYYIEVLEDVKDADSISLGIKIRNINYRFKLKRG